VTNSHVRDTSTSEIQIARLEFVEFGLPVKKCNFHDEATSKVNRKVCDMKMRSCDDIEMMLL